MQNIQQIRYDTFLQNKTVIKQKIFHILLFLSLLLFFNVFGALLLLLVEPALDYVNSFYLMLSTTTTVGYGNIAPQTNNGKIFISFYQFIPITLFFFSIANIY